MLISRSLSNQRRNKHINNGFSRSILIFKEKASRIEEGLWWFTLVNTQNERNTDSL